MIKGVITEKPVKIDYNKNWMIVNLTEPEIKLLTDREGVISTGSLGYITPDKVVRYFSKQFGEIFEGSPDLRVRIDFEDKWESYKLAGDYSFYHRNSEKPGDLDVILFGPILISDIEQNKIDPKYIFEDNSGRIIPITREIIEDKINKGFENLDKDGGLYPSIGYLERLSKAGGFDYSERITQLEKCSIQKKLENYSTRENLEDVLYTLETMDDEATLYDFLENLPKIDLPGEFKDRAIKILNGVVECCGYEITEIQEKLKEDAKWLGDLRKQKKRVQDLVCQLDNKK